MDEIERLFQVNVYHKDELVGAFRMDGVPRVGESFFASKTISARHLSLEYIVERVHWFPYDYGTSVNLTVRIKRLENNA